MAITRTTTRPSARRPHSHAPAGSCIAAATRRGTAGRACTSVAVAGALAFVAFDASAQYAVPAPPPTGEAAPATAAAPGPATAAAPARTPPLQASLAADFEFTDNVNLAPSGQRQSDFVTQITPLLNINERGAHTSLHGTIAAPMLLYARTGGENNAVRPEVDLNGTAELYPRLFYIDGSVQVSQQYFSPFGARPQDLASATNNRYTAQSYRIAPYIKGQGGEGLTYQLRDDNFWTNASSAPAATNRAYTNEITGTLARDPRPLGWAVSYDRSDTRYTNQDPFRSEIGRTSALWRPDPAYELSLTGGYEDDRYPLSSFSGLTYGAGVKWRPTDRTNVEANYEHRFFGASYHVSFDHRMPLSVWSLRAQRDISSTPQQFANLGPGSDVGALLNQLFSSRFADPAARQVFVDQLIRDRGLPAVLSSPLSLYTQQITLQESVQATVGLLGARNSIFLTVYRTRSEPIAGGTATPIDLFGPQVENTQTGTNVVWTYKLTTLYTLITSGDWFRTVANDSSGGRSNQGTLRIAISAPLSPLTSIVAGARYQRLTSNVQFGYNETAAFAGISHLFK